MTNTKPPFNTFRILPIILESLPVLIILLGFIFKHDFLLVIGFCTASLFYIILPWYFFKALKYTTDGVILSLFLGQVISVVLIGMLFYFLRWESYDIMLLNSSLALIAGIIISGIYMIIKSSHKELGKYEIRMSKKLFSRFVILLLIFVAFNMQSSFILLLKK
jgi:hypothetical protein